VVEEESKTEKGLPKLETWLLSFIATCVLLLHTVALERFGFFRDELYYLANAARLDWGYVDHPPLCVWILKGFTTVLGEQLWVVRLPVVLAGCALVFMAGLLAREFGGGRRAQLMAAVLVAAAPVYRVVGHLYAMNGFDVLFWAVAILVFTRLMKDPKPWRWLALGAIIGLALLNKFSVLWLVAGLLVAVLVSDRRKILLSPWPYAAALLSLAIIAPHLVWQAHHGWPTSEFVRNANSHKLLETTPITFLFVQFAVMNPVTFPLWLLFVGVAWSKKEWRPVAAIFATVVLILLINGRSRENYLSPAYAAIVGPGVVRLESWLREKRDFLYRAGLSVAVLAGVATSLVVMPILDQEQLRKLYNIWPHATPQAERGAKGDLKGLADMHGWQELHDVTKKVYDSLSREDQARVSVYGHNYGEAAAIQHFSKGLWEPRVIGPHNNYWLWGPGDWNGEVLIVVGAMAQEHQALFESYEVVARNNAPWAVPEEANAPVAIARGLRIPVSEFWEKVKRLE
jgi:hypothetical protein